MLAFCYFCVAPPILCFDPKTEVILKNKVMANIQKICDIHPSFYFSEFDLLSRYRKSFEQSELGRLHSCFPFTQFCNRIGLVDKPQGRNPHFSAHGQVALMILKSYTGLSDEDLIAQLNSNIHYQLFCGIWIDPDHPLTNYKLVSSIRCKIASLLDISGCQEVLAEHWKPYLDNLHVFFTDATCYESDIRYPTSVKLLWESVDWLYSRLCSICKDIHICRPRNKYPDVKSAYLSYSKKRKHKNSSTRSMTRRLLALADKLLGQVNTLIKSYRKQLEFSSDCMRRLNVIKEVLSQQNRLFDGKKVSDRIVSVDKHYLRPIVRGKEKKSVEFGAKVNNIQVDGISFIQHISFDAFNEGTLLKDCVSLHQKLFKTRVRALGADAIYGTNANRKFCSTRSIMTSFVRKGRAGKDEPQRKIVRSALSKERATTMEGSFGTQKEYYGVRKIKARRESTEILWIFFAIHTANAVIMAQKIKRKKEKRLLEQKAA